MNYIDNMFGQYSDPWSPQQDRRTLPVCFTLGHQRTDLKVLKTSQWNGLQCTPSPG